MLRVIGFDSLWKKERLANLAAALQNVIKVDVEVSLAKDYSILIVEK